MVVGKDTLHWSLFYSKPIAPLSNTRTIILMYCTPTYYSYWTHTHAHTHRVYIHTWGILKKLLENEYYEKTINKFLLHQHKLIFNSIFSELLDCSQEYMHAYILFLPKINAEVISPNFKEQDSSEGQEFNYILICLDMACLPVFPFKIRFREWTKWKHIHCD